MSGDSILLTGAGKRYDIVSCFARLTHTVVADPAPLAPAQYAAQARAAVPPMDDGGYVAQMHGRAPTLPDHHLLELLRRAEVGIRGQVDLDQRSFSE